MNDQPTRAARIHGIRVALAELRQARNNLRAAGALRAAQYVARALKSAEGAERHALRGGDPTVCPDCDSPLTDRMTNEQGDPIYCDECDRETGRDDSCAECERSNGPHYRGPCVHGGGAHVDR